MAFTFESPPKVKASAFESGTVPNAANFPTTQRAISGAENPNIRCVQFCISMPAALSVGPNCLSQVIDLYWRSRKSGELWCKSRQLKKTFLQGYLAHKKQRPPSTLQ